MSGIIARVRDCYARYRTDAETAWDQVRKDHTEAKAVRDLEYAVSLGIHVMWTWLRAAEAWHDWVSESADRYDEEQHKEIQETEAKLIETTKHMLDVIARVKQQGFEVEQEQAFRELAAMLILRANPLADSEVVAQVRLQAAEAATMSKEFLEPVDHWGGN